MTTTLNGRCLCGKVSFSAANAGNKVGACHCSMCRRWGGGPLLAIDCGTDVSFGGEQFIRAFRSSDWAERGFCAECGSHLFYRLSQGGQYIMPVGLIDNSDGLVFDHQVCIDSKPGYYSFAEQTHNMTCDELFAAFAPPQA